MIYIEAGDIIEHLITLSELAKECSHITEMGVRDCVSTWPLLEGLDKGKLVSIDWNLPPKENLEAVKKFAKQKGLEFEFRQANTLEIEIEPTDLLFIDTDHTYEQLISELALHGEKARKYIVLHDTESSPKLWKAIGNFLSWGGWKVKFHRQNNNGLTALERIV